MNTTQAKNETGFERLGRETQAGFAQLGKVIAERDAEASMRESRLETKMAERDAEASKRENRLVNRMTILVLGGFTLAVAVLKLI